MTQGMEKLRGTYLRQQLVKASLWPLLRWEPLKDPKEGFSIMLGVPWDLRHLLDINLQFIAATDLEHLDAIHVIFDRARKDGYEALADAMHKKHPDLPLRFSHYPPMIGKIVERANSPNFYNATNCALALERVETRYVILHDFDLYPIQKNYFPAVYHALRDRDWHFCGLQHTHFSGLTSEENVLGTWCLGMEAARIRNQFNPLDIYHCVVPLNGRTVRLDPFSWIQLQSEHRGLCGTIDINACCHVTNLCSTYLALLKNQPVKVAWRMHYLWYLEYLSHARALEPIIEAMDAADASQITVDGRVCNLDDVQPTCANVLARDVSRMEEFLFGHVRPEVARYTEAFRRFLEGPVQADLAST